MGGRSEEGSSGRERGGRNKREERGRRGRKGEERERVRKERWGEEKRGSEGVRDGGEEKRGSERVREEKGREKKENICNCHCLLKPGNKKLNRPGNTMQQCMYTCTLHTF